MKSFKQFLIESVTSEKDDDRVTIKPKDNPKLEFTFKKTTVKGR